MAAAMVAAERMARVGQAIPRIMRRVCALETMDSLSSISAWCYIARSRAHLDVYCAAAFFSFSTARWSLLLADSLSSLAADAGKSSDRGFFSTGFFFFSTGFFAAGGGSPGFASSGIVDEKRGKAGGAGE